MNNASFTITSKQLIFIILGTILGGAILSLPRVASAEAGQDAWIAVLVGALIPLASLFMIERLWRQFPQRGFVDLSLELFGRYVGGVLVAGFVCYGIFFASVSLRLFVEITSTYMLPTTPKVVVVFILIMALVYVAGKGAQVVARVNELLFYFFLLLFLLAIPSLTIAEYTNLLPVGGSGAVAILKSSLTTNWAFAGVEILFIIYPMTTHRDEVLKAGLTALFITIGLFLSITLVCLIAYGATLIQYKLWPAITLLKEVDIPVLRRLELFFLTFWLSQGARPVMNLLMASSFSLTGFFGLNVHKYYQIMLPFLGLIVGIIALVPGDVLQAFQWANYAGYAFGAVSLGYPILYHLAVLVRKVVGRDG